MFRGFRVSVTPVTFVTPGTDRGSGVSGQGAVIPLSASGLGPSHGFAAGPSRCMRGCIRLHPRLLAGVPVSRNGRIGHQPEKHCPCRTLLKRAGRGVRMDNGFRFGAHGVRGGEISDIEADGGNTSSVEARLLFPGTISISAY